MMVTKSYSVSKAQLVRICGMHAAHASHAHAHVRMNLNHVWTGCNVYVLRLLSISRPV